MILKCFSLLDTKSGYYNQPFFFQHTAQAIRAVMELASDMQTIVARHPSDFALVELSDFDDQSGLFVQNTPPKHIGLVVQFVEIARQSQGRLALEALPHKTNGNTELPASEEGHA